MSTVWMLHPIKDDVSSAEQYGQLRPINSRYVYPDELQGSAELPQGFRDNMARAANQFDPVRDYFLLGGDYVQMVYFAGLLAIQYGKFRTLRFDRDGKGYVVVKIGPLWWPKYRNRRHKKEQKRIQKCLILKSKMNWKHKKEPYK